MRKLLSAELKPFCWLLAATVSLSSAASAEPSGDVATATQSLDLGSTDRNRSAELPLGAAISIQVGDNSRTITSADLLTAAEHIAVQQVVSGTGQQLLLSGAGGAVGGAFHLTDNSLQNLVIPSGVTVLRDFGVAQTLNLAGTLTNEGNFFAFSSNQLVTNATIAAAQIFNQQGAVISTVLPENFASLQSMGSLNLTLSAMQNIINAGTIRSAGNLTLIAGDSIVNSANVAASGPSMSVLQALGNVNLQAANIVNSGVLSASANVSVSSQTLRDLLINNTAGRIEALNGAVSVRDALFRESLNLSIIGGDILSRSVNLFSGEGKIDVNVGRLTGLVNLQACEAHIQADTPNLVFGSVHLSGDPVFISTGNLVLPAATSGQPFIAVAGGNITVTPGFTLDTSSVTSSGGSIYLISGANASVGGGTVTVTGRSGLGGDVDLTGISSIDSSSSFAAGIGGDITLVAFANVAGSSTGGHIIVPAGLTMKSGDSSGAGAGKLVAVADASSSAGLTDSINIGGFDARSATPGTSEVSLLTIAPNITTANPLKIDAANGAINSGSITTGTLQTGGVITGAIAAPGAAVEIRAGGDIRTGIITAESVNLSSSTGTIGAPGMPIETNAGILAANTTGNVYLRDTASVVHLAKSSGDLFSLHAPNGRIDLTGDVTANGMLTLSALSGIKSLEQVTSIPVGLSPTGVAVSPLSTLVFVANSASNTVSVIDTASNTVAKVIPVGLNPRGLAVSPDGTRVYVANLNSDTVSVIDVASGTVVKTIAVPGGPAGVTFNSSGSTAFVSSSLAGTVTFIDTSSAEVVGAPVIVQNGPVALAFNRSNSLLYVGNQLSNSISVINPTDRSLINVPLAFSPVAFGPCPCGTKIFVADGVNSIYAFSAETNTVLVTIPMGAGSQPVGIGINPTGSLAYAVNAGAGTVSTVTTLTNSISTTTAVGGVPRAFGGFAGFVGNSAVAYISNSTGNSVSVLRTPIISAPSYSLLSDSGQINLNVVSGSVQASNTNGSVVITSANSIASTGGIGTAYQLATPKNIDVTGPLTARLMDLHAINGVFTNRSVLTATSALFFIASPSIINYGTIQTVHNTGAGTVGFQAPSGLLNVSLAPGSVVRSSAPGNIGTLVLNPAGGASIVVSGQAGSLITADAIDLQGNRGAHTINFNVDRVDGEIFIRRSATDAIIANSTGNLALGTASLNQTGGIGSKLNVSSAGNLSVASIDANYSGMQSNQTYLYLISRGNVAFNGGISADGMGTANGGTINVEAPYGSISLANSSVSAFTASGQSGGVILLSAQTYQIDAKNSDGSSLNASGSAGPGGYIQIVSTSVTPLTIGAVSGTSFIEGNIVATGSSGGTIRIAASSLVVAPGGIVTATGTTGNGGTVGVAFGAPLNVVNDGTIIATNLANSSGAVAFDSGTTGIVSLTGSGTVSAGGFVSFGTINPSTLLPSSALLFSPAANFQFGGISIQQGSPVGNLIAVSGGGKLEGSAPIATANSTNPAGAAGLPSMAFVPPQLPENALVQTDKVRISFATQQAITSERSTAGSGVLNAVFVQSAKDFARTDATESNTYSGAVFQNYRERNSFTPNTHPPSSVVDSEVVDLPRGRFLVNAATDLNLNARFSRVSVRKGAVVLINLQDDSLSVYDIHDRERGDVKVFAGTHNAKLSPGAALYVSQHSDIPLAQMNKESLPLRQIVKSQVSTAKAPLWITTADFSLPAAVVKVGLLSKVDRALSVSERKMLHDVYKSAAALSIINRNQGPFRTP